MKHTILALLIMLGACTADGSYLEPSVGPDVKADSSDQADRDCRIVLRTLAQPNGLPSHHADGVNWVVYEGYVDAAADAGRVPMALYSNGHDGWWQVAATRTTDDAVFGFHRYKFTLDRYTVPTGDNAAWRNMRIEVIPYLAAEGGRLFDHNRYRADFENYAITKDETQYDDDPTVCHHVAGATRTRSPASG